jgi:hypothetical protein
MSETHPRRRQRIQRACSRHLAVDEEYLALAKTLLGAFTKIRGR